MWHDLRYAARQLRKSPVFTAAAILTLTLGIGANTAIYQVLDALLFRALPVRDPTRLVRITLLEDGKPAAFNYPAYLDLAARQQAAEGLFATSDYPLHAAILRGRGQAHPVNAVLATAAYFQVLGVSAPVGRVFTPADDRAPVAVISDAFWDREFGRSRDAIGQPLRINKAIVTVIGVAPPEFTGEKPGNAPDAWLPMGLAPELMATDWLHAPKASWLTVMARLRLGVTVTEARQSFETAAGHAIRVDPGSRGLADLQTRFENPVLLLMAAVGLVLLIACCNLATLLLGRAAARSQEMAVRMALGAGRARLVRQLLVESFLLAGTGAAAGLVLSRWASAQLVAQPAGIGALSVQFNWRVVAFAVAAAVLATVLSGLAPALSATRISRYPGPRRRWLGQALIAAQVAVSLLLLSGAGLLSRSLWNLRHQDFGFRPGRLLLVDLPWEFSPSMMARYAALRGPLFDRMNALPGVQSAAISGFGPLGSDVHTGPIAAPGVPSSMARIVHISPRYFETAGIPIVARRSIGADDRAGAPRVAVLSETAARRMFGGAGPIGPFLSPDKTFDASHAIEIVGVAHDVRFAHPADPFGVEIYVPLEQSPAPVTAIPRALAAIPRRSRPASAPSCATSIPIWQSAPSAPRPPRSSPCSDTSG